MKGRFLETAGLPGSGKTTILNMLQQQAWDGPVDIQPARMLTKNAFVNRILIPWTYLRFLSTFRVLHRKSGQATGFWTWSVSVVMKAISGRGKRDSRHVAVNILDFLNEFWMEYGLVRLQAWTSRKHVILDEGFVQRGVGIWLRTPLHYRDELWAQFIASVPRAVRCLVFDCDPGAALERCRLRERGTRAVSRWAPEDCDEATWLSTSYAGMADLLNRDKLARYVNCSALSVTAFPENACENLVKELQRLEPAGDWLIFARN